MSRPLLAAWLLVLAGCRADRVAPVRAEFLLLAGDSTFWVRSGSQGVRVRGSPIQLARYDGTFYELYVGDDDRSHYDGVIIGQRIYRRDLLSGDSAVVFEDSTIASFAEWYAREHPEDRKLAPEEEPAEEPHTSATSDIRILSHHGPYLSFEYRADAEMVGNDGWHIARRGVVDLRNGRSATLAAIVGDSAAGEVLERGRRFFVQAVDSVLSSGDVRANPAIRAIGDFEFDSSSFALVNVNRALAVEFLVPGRRGDAEGLTLPLPLIPVPTPSWWSEISDALPAGQDSAGTEDRWEGKGYRVLARYDLGPDRARVTLVDTAGREWPVARVPAPAWRVFPLDSGVESRLREALSRAFDEAALYDEEARTASRAGAGVQLAFARHSRTALTP
jgi:hypothetical protein